MTDDDFLRNQREMFGDAKIQAMIEATATLPEASASGGGDDLGGDFPGDLGDLGLPGAETEALPDVLDTDDAAGEEIDPAAPEDGDLLSTPPGRRNDKRKYKKSTYRPVDRDGRKHAGTPKRIKAESRPEIATMRKVFPGSQKDSTLGLTQIYKEDANSYNTEENQIFEVQKQHREIKTLIEQLEKREGNEDDETQKEQTQ